MSYLNLNSKVTFGEKYIVDVRCLIQARRDEINAAATPNATNNPFSVPDPALHTQLLADALIAGWTGCDDLELMSVGIFCEPAPASEGGGLQMKDPEDGKVLGTLTGVNELGEIPYSLANAQLIYKHADRAKFAHRLNEASSRALEGLRLRKKLERASSGPSSPPSA